MTDSRTLHLVDATLFYAREGGGVRTYLAAKARWMAAQRRFRHTVVSPDLDESERDAGVRHESVASWPIPWGRHYRMPRSVFATADRLLSLQPDIIEVGDPYHFAWAAIRAGEQCGAPVVAYYHSDLPGLVQRRFGRSAGRLAQEYVARLYQRFDAVFAPSATVADRLKALGVARVVLQPLGVDTQVFSPIRRTGVLRKRLGLPSGTRLLVFAGRFTREKRLPLLVETVERLGDPYHLLLIGAGDPLPSSPRCTCLPFERDSRSLAGMMADCDAFIHCGERETFGLAVLEAMACGLPVVGMAAGGVGELINSETGIRVPCGRDGRLADAIDALFLSDPLALGEAARRRAVEEFDWDKVISKLAMYYESLLAAPRPANIQTELAYAGK